MQTKTERNENEALSPRTASTDSQYPADGTAAFDDLPPKVLANEINAGFIRALDAYNSGRKRC